MPALLPCGPPSPTVPDSSAIFVSVVMPCLNESRTVASCVGKALVGLRELGLPGEVLVADNGSTDGSAALAHAHGARVLEVAPGGYSNALRGGIAAAQGRYVIVGDADDSYDLTQLKPFVDLLDQGFDLVVGNRFRGGIRPGAMPWLHRRIGNPLLTALLTRLYGSPIGDSQCGLRAFRKAAYESWDLASPGMEFASEMIARACLHRARIAEVPTPPYPDGRDRRPHLRTFRDGWRNLRLLLALRLTSGA